jgi:adenylate cyclase
MTAAAPTVAGAVRTADRRAMLQRLQMHFGLCMMLANIAGGLIVFTFLGFVLPRPQRLLNANLIALGTYLPFSVVVGCAVSARAFQPIRDWVLGERPMTGEARHYIVRHPLRQAAINFGLWIGSIVVFIPINVQYGVRNELDIAHTILLGAITTCGLGYLFAERMLRPLNELAFEDDLPTDKYVPGVKSRLMLAWIIGSAIPLLGIVSVAIDHGSRPVSIPGIILLGCVGLASGALALAFAAKSVADPIESVTTALSAVERDRLDVKVPVYDGSQIGQLQNGFNSMVEGLRERRRLRDLFGRQVGTDVARQALERGVHLGGEQVFASMLFVDVIGSTELAAARPAPEVVAALNAFFAVVVDVIDRTGGFVNKFEGDAALCVFGAPVPREDSATCALLAARLLHERLRDVRGLSAAIGVSAGTVVAGNIGTNERFEYTVIGDAVNEAARLTELAKGHSLKVLASATVLAAADETEQAFWRGDGTATLRGRTSATELATLQVG